MENTSNNTEKQKKIKLNFKDSKYATGRRKKSIAKVWVKKGSGNIHVNGLKMSEYFKRPVHQILVTRPLEITEATKNYDIKCSVKGGGLSGQAGAIILGISKALIALSLIICFIGIFLSLNSFLISEYINESSKFIFFASLLLFA